MNKELFQAARGENQASFLIRPGQRSPSALSGACPVCSLCNYFPSNLYWTDWNREAPKIETATVNGANRRVLVNKDIGLPNGLTFDPFSKLLCWADAGNSLGTGHTPSTEGENCCVGLWGYLQSSLSSSAVLVPKIFGVTGLGDPQHELLLRPQAEKLLQKIVERCFCLLLWPGNHLACEKARRTWSARSPTGQAGASYRTTSTTPSASSVTPTTSTTPTGDGKGKNLLPAAARAERAAYRGLKKCKTLSPARSHVLEPHQSTALGLLQCHGQQQALVNLS